MQEKQDQKVVRAILASMYRTGTYTGIEIPTFSTGLNTGHIGYVLTIPANFKQYRQVPGVPVSTEKSFYFYFFF